MNLSLRSLLLSLLLVPLTGLGQSYEWSNRTRETRLFAVAPSEQGTYSVGITDCRHGCYGLLSKYDNEDGSLIWRRKFLLENLTYPIALAVNSAGVFVAGHTEDINLPPSERVLRSFVRSYSHDGQTVWTKLMKHPTFIFDIVAKADSVYAVGYQELDGPNRGVLRCLGNDGEIRWTRFMGEDIFNSTLLLGDDRLYLQTGRGSSVTTVRTSDGELLGSFPLSARAGFTHPMTYYAGFLYVIEDFAALAKYRVNGEQIWRQEFGEESGVHVLDSIAASADGVYVGAEVTRLRQEDGFQPIKAGRELWHFDHDGSVRGQMRFPGHWPQIAELAVRDGAIYATGLIGEKSPGYTIDVEFGFVGRFSEKDLIRPSLLALAGSTPAMPPRLAVLHHDYGAGPVRVGIRDAAPGSHEYVFGFSDGLTPVSFHHVADLNGNGYEELVVVSRLPAVAEVRDSLDGSLVSTIRIGSHLEPLVATVEQRDGAPPRLAVAARNRTSDNLLLRLYNLMTGNLLASNFYNPGFDPVDVAALPGSTGNGAHRYALLGRNRIPGSPHQVEVRWGDGNLAGHGHYWMGRNQDPLQLSSAGDMDGLAVLRDAVRPGRSADVVRVDLATADEQRVRFSRNLTPLAMLELPDSDGNGYPQYMLFGEETDGEPVEAETRDLVTGIIDHNVYTGSYYRPEDAVHIGALPGYSPNAYGALRMRQIQKNLEHMVEHRAIVIDAATGTKLFDLGFNLDDPN